MFDKSITNVEQALGRTQSELSMTVLATDRPRSASPAFVLPRLVLHEPSMQFDLARPNVAHAINMPFKPISDIINTSSPKQPQEIYGEPENFLEVEVRHPVTHNQGGHLYTDYEIVCRTNIPRFHKRQSRVRRRYSDFVALRRLLEQELTRVMIPPLPGKILLSSNKFNDVNIEARRQGLEKFLTTVSSHPLLQTGSRLLIEFIQNEKWDPKQHV